MSSGNGGDKAAQNRVHRDSASIWPGWSTARIDVLRFYVDNKQVTVEVGTAAERTSQGNLQPDRVKVAARAFLEQQIGKQGTEKLPGNLLLTEFEMDLTLKRLGWPARF